MSIEPIKILADVIQSEMGLKAGQVLLAYQKFNIPTKGLLIVLSYAGPSVIIGSGDEWQDDGAGGLTEVQTLTVFHHIQIDIMAFSQGGANEARQRKEEVAQAIHSFYSEEQQELNQMQIARQPGPFRDTSFLESTEFLQRYTTDVKVTSAMTKSKPADYYSDLSRAVPPLLTANA